MKKDISWVHLSDFHYGKSDYEQRFSSEKLLEHLSIELGKGRRPDLIFITGDITQSGECAQFEKFVSEVVGPIRELYRDELSVQLHLAPGNHDVIRSVHKNFSKTKYLKIDSGAFLPTTESQADRSMLVDRFANFTKVDDFSYAYMFAFEDGVAWAEHQIKENRVFVVSINTAWLSDGDSDKGNLTPGFQLVRDALERLDMDSVKFVIGHHPLDWLHETVRKPLSTLFGKHNVIYLHGHMHDAWAAPTLSPSGEYMTIQSGAAWQAPEGGKEQNGFLWGELCVEKKEVVLQPFTWDFDDQCWKLNSLSLPEQCRVGDVWKFSAPGRTREFDYTPKLRPTQLPGWEIKSVDDLLACDSALDKGAAIRYFDGASPTWESSLSKSIPRREIVYKIADYVEAQIGKSFVCLLLGAGCEGKTTAIMQAAFEVLKNNPDVRVIYRTNPLRSLDVANLVEILKAHPQWLFVVDEADQNAAGLNKFIENEVSEFGVKIGFLLASRYSDWISSGANMLAWDYEAKYKEFKLKDISKREAEEIVNSWAQYGEDGLGAELFSLDESKRADKLKYYARKEAQGGVDAFFGALLIARHGSDLLDHAESMLSNLDQVRLNDDNTLMDALGYIAAMHAEGYDKLTFATLAGVLQVSASKVQGQVIKPLGREAAATTTANLIFTRHGRIARAIVDVLEKNFDKNIGEYFVRMAVSEQNRSNSETVSSLNFWLFELSEDLFKQGKTDLAIRIAEELKGNDEGNFHLLTKLASLYRRENNAPHAVTLFRGYSYRPSHRGFYLEWGVCEGKVGNYLHNSLLASYALSDDVESSAVTSEQALMILNALGVCFNQLYNFHVDRVFEQAAHAALSLAYSLQQKLNSIKVKVAPKESPHIYEFLRQVSRKRANFYEWKEAIRIISVAARMVFKYGNAVELRKLIDIDFSLVTYEGLSRLMENASQDVAIKI